MIRTAIIPGSFDPMTLGHRDIVLRSLKLFDRIIVAIMINPQKQDTAMFSFIERKKIAELTLDGIEGVTVVTADGYLADLAAAFKASAIVKGVRNEADYIYEQEMAVFNHGRNPVCETVYLPAYGDMEGISSSKARECIKNNVSVSDILHPDAVKYIKDCK